MVANNRAFWRALHSLSHPMSIAAVLLLLINDHYLRIQHASWLTGKLGDFAWLVFAPFIAALFFALIVPRRMPNQERITGMLAFIAIGAWFALAKTVPAVHQVTASAWDGVVGWPGTLRMDATDLLTLPGMLVGWLIWQRAANTSINLRPVAYAAFGFGLMGTLASADYDLGITCLFMNDTSSTIYTGAFGGDKSDDGGLTWTSMSEERVFPETSDPNDPRMPAYQIEYASFCDRTDEVVMPDNSQLVFRFPQGGNIEKSTDGGRTWQTDYRLDTYYQEARAYYHNQEIQLDLLIKPGVGHALFHQATGNLILTMGHDGLLVRTPDGTWHPVGVNGYRLIDISHFNLNTARNLLSLQYMLAVTLCFLILTTVMEFIRGARDLRRYALVAGWLGWILLVFLFNPIDGEILSDNIIQGGVLGLAMLVFIALPLSLGAIWDVARNFRPIVPHILVACVLANVAFLFPFMLWTTGTVPRYNTAALFAILLTFSVLLALFAFYKPRFPVLEKEKRKNEDVSS